MSDPLWDYVCTLVRFNGSNGSTTITDDGPNPKTYTAAGNAQLSTTNPKFGTACGLFDGTGDVWTAPHAADMPSGTQEFCIETFVRLDSLAASKIIVNKGTGTGNYSFQLWYDASINKFRARFINSALIVVADLGNVAGNPTLSTGTWYHLAVTRENTTQSTWRLFVNGTTRHTLVTGTGIALFDSTGSPLCVGAYSTGASSLQGALDEFRITTGRARYTTDFTAPTAEYEGAPPEIQRNWRKTQYLPGTQGSDLITFARNELERVNNALESGWTHELLDKLTQEPTRKRIGQMVYADGSLWNPGSGEGVYILTSSGWQKLG